MSAKPVVIESVPTRVVVRYGGERFRASLTLQREIDRHWQQRLRDGASFTRGPVLHVTSVTRRDGEMSVNTVLTDYAHYLHTVEGGNSDCRVLYTAALLRTQDGSYIVGEMAPHTSSPGRVQCAGGGLQLTDFHDGVADLESQVRAEIQEETGITDDQMLRLEPAYLKSGGQHGFLAIMFVAELALGESEVIEQFGRQGQSAAGEFSALVAVPARAEAVHRFLADDPRPRVDYLDPLLSIGVNP